MEIKIKNWKKIEALNGVYYSKDNIFVPEKDFLEIFKEGQKDILKIYLKQFEDKTNDRTCLWNCMADDLDEINEGRDINRDL